MSRTTNYLYTYADIRAAVNDSTFRQKYAFSENTGVCVNKAETLLRLFVRADALPDNRMPTYDDLAEASLFSCSSTERDMDDMGSGYFEKWFDVGSSSGAIVFVAIMVTSSTINIFYEGNIIFTMYQDGGAETYSFHYTHNISNELLVQYIQ